MPADLLGDPSAALVAALVAQPELVKVVGHKVLDDLGSYGDRKVGSGGGHDRLLHDREMLLGTSNHSETFKSARLRPTHCL